MTNTKTVTVPEVSLPDRVIDCLWQGAGLSTYHPDGDQLGKFHEFAILVKTEVLARLAAAPQQAQGCCRSHPHEDMDEECERKTVEARRANAARQAQAGEAVNAQLVVGTAASHNELAVVVHLQRGDHTTVLYSKNHSLNGDTVGASNVPPLFAALHAQPTPVVAEQEPVATLHDDGYWTWKGTPPHESNYAGWRMEVYAHPAAVQRDEQERDKVLEEVVDVVCEHFGEEDFKPSLLSIVRAIRALKTAKAGEQEAKPELSPPRFNSLGIAEHWAVTVHAEGRQVLCIESQCYGGIEDIDPYAETIRNCARHLMAFIGSGEEDAAPPQAEAQSKEEHVCRDCLNTGVQHGVYHKHPCHCGAQSKDKP
jgi:hypothetical protein